MYCYNVNNIGEFVEKEYGKTFTYRRTSNTWALQSGLTHEIDVLDGIRFANVLKTCCYVATDEEPDGSPKLEKWYIKNHVVFGG